MIKIILSIIIGSLVLVLGFIMGWEFMVYMAHGA